jgi:hypothetical protein
VHCTQYVIWRQNFAAVFAHLMIDYFITLIQLQILIFSIMAKGSKAHSVLLWQANSYYPHSLPVNILGIEFLWTIFMTRFVGPTISKKNPTREQLIAIKHNIIITRIKLAISGVTHRRTENWTRNSVTSPQQRNTVLWLYVLWPARQKECHKEYQTNIDLMYIHFSC